MKSHMKRLLNRLGYDIQRISHASPARDDQECPSGHELYNVFCSHKSDIDIYQHADRHSPRVSSFKYKLTNRTYKFIGCSCAICNSSDYTLVAKSIEGFIWGICKDCGLLQIYNRLRDDDINRFYESGEYQAICMSDLNDEKHFSLEYQIMSLYFIDIFNVLGLRPRDTRIIEIGCGSGGILLALKEWGAMSVKGYDIDQHRVDYGKTLIPEIEFGDALSLSPDVYSNYNVILLSNVLEHLTNPQEFLARMVSQIGSLDVRIVIDVPNLEYCYSYSEISFLRFLHIGHLWYFNSITIERILNQAGLGIDYIFPRGAAFTLICSKRLEAIDNPNNGYWSSVSAINYANYLNDPKNIGVEVKGRMKLMS